MTIKEQLVARLNNELVATEVELNEDYESITVWFKRGSKEGSFEYSLFGSETKGIDEVYYDEDDEDIYAEIHDWVEKHLEYGTWIRCDGVDLKKQYRILK